MPDSSKGLIKKIIQNRFFKEDYQNDKVSKQVKNGKTEIMKRLGR